LAVIDFHLDPRSAVPVYVQLIQQVRHALRFGLLGVGDRLPTVKEVVAQVAVNPNTVLRAYRDLEAGGLVLSRPGLGTFVTAVVGASVPTEVQARLRAELENWVAAAEAEGLDDEAMRSLFGDVLRRRLHEVA
jgi:GntR family transcriptional regulator